MNTVGNPAVLSDKTVGTSLGTSLSGTSLSGASLSGASLETTIFFEKKVSLTPKEMNEIKQTSVDELVLKKAKGNVENKCSEHGFVLPGSVALISRSMGYFESARFTGDSNYYVKLQANVLYPVDGMRLVGKVIRKNKMGLYVNYRDAIHVQVPRDLHVGDQEYDEVQIGDSIMVELKRSKFAINDEFILSSGQFLQKVDGEQEVEAVPAAETIEEEEAPTVDEVPAVEEPPEEKSEETAPPSASLVPVAPAVPVEPAVPEAQTEVALEPVQPSKEIAAPKKRKPKAAIES